MKRRILLLVVVSIGILVAAPFVGPPLPAGAEDFVFWHLRMPRVLMAVLVGSTLSLVGVVYQSLFSNPLAAPSTVGTTAGAMLGAVAALVLGASFHAWGVSFIVGAAFLGAIGVSLLVAAIAARRRVRINDLVLAGLAVSLAASSLSTGLQQSADSATLAAAMQWSLGHLPQVGYRGVLILLPFCLISCAGLLGQIRNLEALAWGEELAYARGVNIRRLRASVIGLAALGVAACTAWCGPIAFVELIVPHLVRLALGASRRIILPMSAVTGAAFLAACDTVARILIPGRDLPVGMLTAAMGAPLLVLLLTRQVRTQGAIHGG
ncbi:FecCD family ABC transporter permease [Hyalangium versicolor]|uniref:FecCD family ABC transporter permease n=1 Tax=Hyalangium versicolor TaxID=2861190 RepID=UPI001CCD9B33|nr:iron ABC transporter permease [Hyalangium versicolor]